MFGKRQIVTLSAVLGALATAIVIVYSIEESGVAGRLHSGERTSSKIKTSFPRSKVPVVEDRPNIKSTIHYDFWERYLKRSLQNRHDFEAYRVTDEHSFGGVMGAVDIRSDYGVKTIFVWKDVPADTQNVVEVRSVVGDEWSDFKKMISEVDYWKLNHGIDEVSGILDGGSCVIEAVSDSKYHVVIRNNSMGKLKKICSWAIEKSRHSVE